MKFVHVIKDASIQTFILGPGETYVRGYARKDGTEVKGHTRGGAPPRYRWAGLTQALGSIPSDFIPGPEEPQA